METLDDPNDQPNDRIAKLEQEVRELQNRLARIEQGQHLQAGNGIVINGTMIALATPQQNWPLPTGLNQVLMSPDGFPTWVDTTECG